ncbi:hypothetical protein [Scytonema sp. NUACC26]|uniref:hypothetical protein n=1 Tax=Scytonema sp. NUACC26 TaxID=3140176 RepID=UPI0034DC91F3
MYNDELESRQLSLEQLFLDPNNPRFSSERDKSTPEHKIPDPKIQEKTLKRMSENFGVKDSVQLEYAKFRDLQRTGQFAEYLAALGTGNSADGRAVCYAMFASAEFKEPSREYARREGVLLRSRRQAAFWLSQSFSIDSLCQMRQKVSTTLIRNLSRNLAPVITPYRRDTAFATLRPPQI